MAWDTIQPGLPSIQLNFAAGYSVNPLQPDSEAPAGAVAGVVHTEIFNALLYVSVAGKTNEYAILKSTYVFFSILRLEYALVFRG